MVITGRKLALVVPALSALGLWIVDDARAADWLMGGQNLRNTRHQGDERRINPDSVEQLRGLWAVELRGNIEATPAVEGDAIYVPDEAGSLYKIDATDGSVIWSNPVASYTDIEGDTTRATPAVGQDRLIFGTQSGGPQAVLDAPERGWLPGPGAWLVAVDKASGKDLWQKQLETHPASRINQSAVMHDGHAYVGITSWEEVIAAIMPDYDCCSFRGSVVRVDIGTGEKTWQTYTVPEGYSGGAVWGSTPVVDPGRGLVYVTTGNNYRLPQSVSDCVAQALEDDPSGEASVEGCYAAGNYFDAVIALDLDTGAVRWVHQTIPFDAHTHACWLPSVNPQNCPSPRGPDYDFAQGPMLFTVAGSGRELLGAGQKSGVFWALEPDSGEVIWRTQVGPGGMTGGLQWGSATDGKRIYVAISNHAKQRWVLKGQGPYAGQVALRGFWSALDAATGEILWQTPDPNAFASDQGMMTSANGVVFAGSMAGGTDNANMFALDAATGEILWQFPSVGSVVAGAAVVDGRVYWGSSYTQWDGVESNKLFAFGLE